MDIFKRVANNSKAKVKNPDIDVLHLCLLSDSDMKTEHSSLLCKGSNTTCDTCAEHVSNLENKKRQLKRNIGNACGISPFTAIARIWYLSHTFFVMSFVT